MKERLRIIAETWQCVIVIEKFSGSSNLFYSSSCCTLIQTKKIKPFPVILYGKEYWEGLIKWIKEKLDKKGYISPRDKFLFKLVDTPEEVVKIIAKNKKNKK